MLKMNVGGLDVPDGIYPNSAVWMKGEPSSPVCPEPSHSPALLSVPFVWVFGDFLQHPPGDKISGVKGVLVR